MTFSKKTLLVTCCVLALVNCFAGKADKFDKKLYKKEADDAFKDGSIFGAADLYIQILQHDSTETSVLYNLAECYYLAKDYELAAVYFKRSYKADAVKNATSLYYQALNTKMQGKYLEALPLFRQFLKTYTGDDAVKMKKWAHTEIDGCNFALKESKPDPSVKLTHLGKEVNSNYADQAPALRDDQLYFSSIHSDTVITMKKDKSDAKKEGNLMKLFSSKVSGDTYAPAEQIKTFSQEGKHISNGSFNEDGTKFFYTICDGLLKPKCDIYMSQLDGTDWDKGKALNSAINLAGCTNTYPCLAKNANGTETLYFVSDREGGKGGLDIWYSIMSKNGDFGAPKNAGSKINSDRDERSPFFDSKTNTLYFSSEGWIGMGGLDIFKAQSSGPEKYTSNPENLGAPFNSPCNDYYFRYGKSSKEGYLVSNRPGIFSVRGKTCCDDIFTYQYINQIFLAVKTRVFDDATKIQLASATVNLSLQSHNAEEGDVTIGTDTTTAEAAVLFNLKQNKLYKITATRSGYFTGSQTFNTEGITKSDTQTVDIYLKKLEKNKAYRLNNIYYDFDKADLRPESKATLDTLYKILIENPTIIIELSSHTDSRGAEDYNLNLSQRRAESCVNYLINEKAIPKERIIAKGYGKNKLLEDCSKYPECPQTQNGDCPCHQLNRRTEFKIIGELDIKINDNE